MALFYFYSSQSPVFARASYATISVFRKTEESNSFRNYVFRFLFSAKLENRFPSSPRVQIKGAPNEISRRGKKDFQFGQFRTFAELFGKRTNEKKGRRKGK